MKLEIKPEPTPEEREAIERALAGAHQEALRLASAWHDEGVRENTANEA